MLDKSRRKRSSPKAATRKRPDQRSDPKRLYKIRRKIPDPTWSLSEIVHPHKPTSPRRPRAHDEQIAMPFVVPKRIEAQPFLKWAGGKAGLLRQLEEFFPHEIDRYFQRAKVLVNTSRAEGFPNTFIQAGKCGASILSFKVNPDGFLDRFVCGLYADGNLEKMIDSLKHLLNNETYLKLGQNGLRYVEQFHDITKIAGQYKDLFGRVLAR